MDGAEEGLAVLPVVGESVASGDGARVGDFVPATTNVVLAVPVCVLSFTLADGVCGVSSRFN